MNHQHISHKPNQQGIVSLLVTIIIMAVLTITVVGFALLMRREQRQTLDRQLNTQAFYAAEAGINDAVAYLNSKPPTDDIFQHTYDTCTGGNSFVKKANPNLQPDIDASSGVAYSCLLVNPSPTSLDYDNIDESPKIIPIVTPPPNKIDTIKVSWQAKDGNTNFNCPGSGSPVTLAPQLSWVSGSCNTGLIRVDVVPIDNITRDDLNNNLRTLFLYPHNGGGPPPTQQIFQAAGSLTGLIVQAQCNAAATPKYCTVKIDVSNFSTGNFYLRMTSLYLPSAVTLEAYKSTSPLPLELTGAQAVIDSTGKANDVLRRVKVRVSLNPLGKGPFPANALQSGDSLCKRLAFIPPPPAASATVIPDPSPPCQLN